MHATQTHDQAKGGSSDLIGELNRPIKTNRCYLTTCLRWKDSVIPEVEADLATQPQKRLEECVTC